MQVTPSVHNQLVTLAKSGDPLVFAACGLSADSQFTVAIIRASAGDTFINLSQLLPFNLHLIGVIYLEDSAADQAASLKSSLKVQHLLKYQPKGSAYLRDGTAVQDAVSKTDVFSDHLLFGLSLPCNQLSDVAQQLEASSQTPLRIFLHDCLEEIFEVRLKDKVKMLFEVSKVCEDKEKANALKAEIKSATKFYNRTDGRSALSACRVVVGSLLEEDRLDFVQESKFDLKPQPQQTRQLVDCGGYYPIDVFFQTPGQCIAGLFAHLYSRCGGLTAANQSLVGGEDFSCHLYSANLGLQEQRPRCFDETLFSFARGLYHPEKPRNVHGQLICKPPIETGQVHSVRGDFIYYHYLHDGFNDAGWGCAYRSLQTLFSWFLCQGFTHKQVPSIVEIQSQLVQMKDKPAKFLGSTEWIGSFEVSYVLNRMLGIDSKILNVSSGAQVITKLDEFKNHFEVYGTPIMIGGGVLAYTMLGVNIHPEKPEESQFLILDPHFKGPDDPKQVTDTKKGGIWWRGQKLFDPAAFYNFCCPIPIKS